MATLMRLPLVEQGKKSWRLRVGLLFNTFPYINIKFSKGKAIK
jgi:hypothetical protein